MELPLKIFSNEISRVKIRRARTDKVGTRMPKSEIKRIPGIWEEENIALGYMRISSLKQKDDLER